jgi:hypothetical protein
MHVEPSPTLDKTPVTEMPTNNQATSTSVHTPVAEEKAAATDAREDIPGSSMSDYPHAQIIQPLGHPDHPAPVENLPHIHLMIQGLLTMEVMKHRGMKVNVRTRIVEMTKRILMKQLRKPTLVVKKSYHAIYTLSNILSRTSSAMFEQESLTASNCEISLSISCLYLNGRASKCVGSSSRYGLGVKNARGVEQLQEEQGVDLS